MEKTFAAGRHGIISSTGSMPPLLQGVWTGTEMIVWGGDYYDAFTLDDGRVAILVADVVLPYGVAMKLVRVLLEERHDGRA